MFESCYVSAFPSSENSQFMHPQQDPAEKKPAAMFDSFFQRDVLDCVVPSQIRVSPCVSHVRRLMLCLSAWA